MDVKRYMHSYFTGDPKFAYEANSTRCRAAVSEAEFVARAQADRARPGASEPSRIEIPSLPDNDHAVVGYGFPDPAFTLPNQPWIREGTDWHNDAC
jgi:hypothetical protein